MVRRTAKRRVAPKIDEPTLDQVIRLLVNGFTRVQIEARCDELLGIDTKQLDAYITEARRRITIAADYDRDHEIGKAIIAIDDLYQRSLRIQDVKTAIAALDRRMKLLGLAAPEKVEQTITETSEPDQHAEMLHIASAYLEPLELPAADKADLAELCRLAAAEIMRRRAADPSHQPNDETTAATPNRKTTRKPKAKARKRAARK